MVAVQNTGGTQEVPRQFICPIKQTVMMNAVTAPDGHSYDEGAWEHYERASRHALRSPLTRAVLPRHRAVPNWNLRTLIKECPAAQAELNALHLEIAIETPLPLEGWDAFTHYSNLALCTVGWASAGAFAGNVAGLVAGWTAGSCMLFFSGTRIHLSMGFMELDWTSPRQTAFWGAWAGFLYGGVIGTLIGIGCGGATHAVHRAMIRTGQVALGSGGGALLGMLAGMLAGPLACFTANACTADGYDVNIVHRRSHAMALEGALVGLVAGLRYAENYERRWSYQAAERAERQAEPQS